ncbi:MAG: acetyltransferase, partial [SAR324 cluster bacterium]|nr:acetyltransferase [SAR324 cluster bacterium]
RPEGADARCRTFPPGGGRKAAAGINALPETDLPKFLEAFEAGFAE